MMIFALFFFNDTATTEIYTLSLHDALPIWRAAARGKCRMEKRFTVKDFFLFVLVVALIVSVWVAMKQYDRQYRVLLQRSEEHTSELQSRQYLVCRLLLEKKKNTIIISH